MSRKIFMAHTLGALDFKGEPRSDFRDEIKIPGGFEFDYDGSSGTAVWPDSTFIPPVPSTHRTVLTGQELMDLFDGRNIEIWPAIEELSKTNNAALDFVNELGRRLNSKINIESARMLTILNALEANTPATADDVTEIKKGWPL